MSSNQDDGRRTYSKQFGWGIFDAYSNGVSSGKMNPIQCSLHIREARLKTAKDIGIRCHTESDAFHHP